jgi:dCMP deaminase
MSFEQRSIPSWDEYFLNICEVIKTRSKDTKTQVGCVLVSINDNRILSTGYNGLKSRCYDNIDWNNRDLVHSLVVHAECNALIYNTSPNEESKLYCTMSPCKNCIKLIASCNVKKIIFKKQYKDANDVKQICDFYNIDFIQFI